MGREWQSKGMLEPWGEGERSTDEGEIEIRSQNEDRTRTKLSEGRKERQVEVKVDAYQGQCGIQHRENWRQRVSKRKAISTVGRTAAEGE